MIPYVYDDEVADYVVGGTIYDISSIIGDSIEIWQDDGDEQTKVREFSQQPVAVNATSGNLKFSAQCIDMQDSILSSAFGAFTSEGAPSVAFPNDYADLFAVLRIQFRDETSPDIYIPKVHLSSSLEIKNLKTGLAHGTLRGIAVSRIMCVTTDNESTRLERFSISNDTCAHLIDTPMIFVSRMQRPLFFHSYDEGENVYTFSRISWEEGVEENVSLVKVSGDFPYNYYVEE